VRPRVKTPVLSLKKKKKKILRGQLSWGFENLSARQVFQRASPLPSSTIAQFTGEKFEHQ
jgi:hypothetical protein